MPPIVDYPEDFLPDELPPADLILSFAEHKGGAELLPEIARMTGARAVIAGVKGFTPEVLEAPLRDLATELGVKAGPLFGILRGAVTGQRVSPPLFETMAIMGRERVLAQVDRGIEILEAM